MQAAQGVHMIAKKPLTARELQGNGIPGIVTLDLRGEINDAWREDCENKLMHVFSFDKVVANELWPIIRKVEQRVGGVL
jgi:hypothetical protein